MGGLLRFFFKFCGWREPARGDVCLRGLIEGLGVCCTTVRAKIAGARGVLIPGQ